MFEERYKKVVENLKHEIDYRNAPVCGDDDFPETHLLIKDIEEILKVLEDIYDAYCAVAVELVEQIDQKIELRRKLRELEQGKVEGE